MQPRCIHAVERMLIRIPAPVLTLVVVAALQEPGYSPEPGSWISKTCVSSQEVANG